MIIPDWLLEKTNEIHDNIPRRTHPLKFSKQIAREKIKRDDKQCKKELAEKIINPHCFTDRILNATVKITLDSHHIKYLHSKIPLNQII